MSPPPVPSASRRLSDGLEGFWSSSRRRLRRRLRRLWQFDRLYLGVSDRLPFDGTLAVAATVYKTRLRVVGVAGAVVTVVAAVVGAVWLSVQAVGFVLTFGWVIGLIALFMQVVEAVSRGRRRRGRANAAGKPRPPEKLVEWTSDAHRVLVRSDARCAYVYVRGTDTVYVLWTTSRRRRVIFSVAAEQQMVSQLQDAATEEELCRVIRRLFPEKIRRLERGTPPYLLGKSRGKSRSGARLGRRGS